MAKSLFPTEDSYALGESFILEHLAAAVERTPLDHDRNYHVWSNNCGSFLVNLAQELDIRVTTPTLVKFVAQRLWKASGGHWVDTVVRQEMNLFYRRNLRMASNKQVVELLVETQAAPLLVNA